jgi:hypothetical protein
MDTPRVERQRKLSPNQMHPLLEAGPGEEEANGRKALRQRGMPEREAACGLC